MDIEAKARLYERSLQRTRRHIEQWMEQHPREEIPELLRDTYALYERCLAGARADLAAYVEGQERHHDATGQGQYER